MDGERAQGSSRCTARIVLAAALVLLVLLLALRFALQPERATRFLLTRVGNTLGLEITASGASEYHLRGTPTLVIRDVVAREPGAAVPVLTADRILLSLPWSTIRARGAVLAAERLELDAPVLQVDALQHWLETRPPSEAPRFPTLEQGIHVRDGVIRSGGDDDWRIADLYIDLPYLAPGARMQARLRGRYEAPPTRVPFDVAMAMQRAGALVDGESTGLGIVGRMAVDTGDDWRLPAHVRLSGPFLLREGAVRMSPLTLGVGAQYDSKDSRLPFSLGAHGPLRFADGKLSLAPVHVVFDGRGDPASNPIPRGDTNGSLVFADALDLQLEGRVASWPQAWPALPEPIGRPEGSIAVALDYEGPLAFSGILGLRAQHGPTRFDGRFRVRDITAWLDSDLATLLPPLDGTASTPVLEIAGARLEGVEISVDDPAVDATVE